MTIFIISIIALGLLVFLMKEYGWADLTGKTRNDLVFETRNKSYGAYEIREKYSNRLLIAFIGMLGFISIAAVTPKFFADSNPVQDGPKETGPRIFTNPTIPKEKEKEKEKEVVENLPKENKQPPAGAPTTANVAPIAVNTPILDTTKNDNKILARTTTIGDTSSNEYKPIVLNPGKCLECIKDSIKNIIHTAPGVDEQASFAYGDYIKNHLKIPTDLGDRGVKSGKIYISFVVDEEGNVSSAKIKKGVYAELDNEARRVIGGMPKWKPAKIKGENVKVSMVIPINIIIEN